MQPLVHVGYQKTASTLLQRHVFTDKRFFRLPWGAPSSHAIEHFLLAHPCRFDAGAIRRHVAENDAKVPVISQEDLLGYPTRGRYYAELTARRIADALPGARILVCIREQRSMILSNYSQYLRQGGCASIEEMLRRDQGRPGFRPQMRLDHFEYDLTYHLLARYFDRSQILMLPVEVLKRDPQRFVTDICRFAGVDAALDPPAAVVNKRSSGLSLVLGRHLNRLLRDPPKRPASYADYPLRVRARNRLVRSIDRLAEQTALNRSLEEKVIKRIDDHVGDYFASSNERAAELIGSDLGALGYRLPSTAAARPERIAASA